MTFYRSVVLVFLFFSVSFGLSRWLWVRYLHAFTRRSLRRLGYHATELKYSFEEIIYLIALPATDHLLQSATVEHMHIVVDYDSLLFPSAQALRVVFIDDHGTKQWIAFLSFDRFHIPVLDEAYALDKLTEAEMMKITTFLFLHPNTHDGIIREVVRKMRA